MRFYHLLSCQFSFFLQVSSSFRWMSIDGPTSSVGLLVQQQQSRGAVPRVRWSRLRQALRRAIVRRLPRILQAQRPAQSGVHVQGAGPVCGGCGTQEPVPGVQAEEVPQCVHEERGWVDAYCEILLTIKCFGDWVLIKEDLRRQGEKMYIEATVIFFEYQSNMLNVILELFFVELTNGSSSNVYLTHWNLLTRAQRASCRKGKKVNTYK